jgi:DNA ligase-1
VTAADPSSAPLDALAQASLAVAATRARTQKTARLAALLRSLSDRELMLAVHYLTGSAPQGKIGVGFALVTRAAESAPAATPSLTLAEVDAALTAISAAHGPGSNRAREATLGSLFVRATAPERDLLFGVLTGELRQGALEGLMVSALAAAEQLDEALVRRGYMMSGDLAAVAHAARSGGAAAVAALGLDVFRPILPMLAQTAEDVGEALAQLADPILEHKLDGARVQLHKDGELIKVYSRGGLDVTAAVPELVAHGLALPARRVVLDGEAIVFHADGRPQPFQITMRRFGRAAAADAALRAELPLAVRWFDCLLVDDDPVLDRPGHERRAALTALAPAATIVPHLVTRDPAAAAAFLAAAFAAGHEGIMAKDLAAPYAAGNRGAAWLKIKKVHTLDLVVIAVEWGSGRRRGWLSNLHLAARDPRSGGYVMLGKTFKGMTDEILTWQTRELVARETSRDGHVVHVRPELVVEIRFSDVQVSPTYPGGLALRLARVVRYRPDKTVAEAATIDDVRAIAVADGVLDRATTGP